MRIPDPASRRRNQGRNSPLRVIIVQTYLQMHMYMYMNTYSDMYMYLA